MEKVRIRIKNNAAVFDPEYDYTPLLPYFSFSVPNYHHIIRSRPHFRQCKICHQYPGRNHSDDHDYVPSWDGKIKFLKRGRLPAGLFWALRKEIEEKENVKFKIKEKVNVPRTTSNRKWLVSEDQYDFQNACVDMAYGTIRKGRGGLILSATGSGKTRIAAAISSRFNCEVLFIVDQLVLLEQAQKDIAKHLGEKVGYVGKSKFKLQRVTVATIQTLHLHRNDSKFLRWFKNVKIVFVDEIHEALSRRNFDVIKIMKPLSVIGLTATLGLSKKPVRLNAYALTGPVIYQYPVKTGMKENVLSKGISVSLEYSNSFNPDSKNWKHEEAYSKYIVRNGERNTLVVRLVERAIKKGKYVIVVVDRLRHLEEISSRLKERGIKYGIVSGTYKGKGIKVEKRFERKDRFEKGSIRCLVVNKVFKKGVDVKRIDLLINASAKPSTNDAVQIFGRGVRKHKDKKGFIQIDISDVSSIPESTVSPNWFTKAAKKRKRALKKAGIVVVSTKFNPDLSMKQNAKDVLRFSEKQFREFFPLFRKE
jgi:superfamily II DNA or RNA helicase